MNDLELLSVILGLRISESLMILVLGWIIGTIPIYFVAKHFNKNVSNDEDFRFYYTFRNIIFYNNSKI